MLPLHKKMLATKHGEIESHGFTPDHGLEEKARELGIEVGRNSAGGITLTGDNRKLYILGMYWYDRIKYEEEAEEMWADRIKLLG